jgi:hypothetical protein
MICVLNAGEGEAARAKPAEVARPAAAART